MSGRRRQSSRSQLLRQKATRVPDRTDAGPKNGPTPKGLVGGSADSWAISRRGARPYRFGSDLSEAEASEPLFLGFSSPRAVSRAANPAATTAAVAAFFATFLSFVPARRGVIFFAFRAVFAFVVFLTFDLAAARFDVGLAVFDLVLLLVLSGLGLRLPALDCLLHDASCLSRRPKHYIGSSFRLTGKGGDLTQARNRVQRFNRMPASPRALGAGRRRHIAC